MSLPVLRRNLAQLTRGWRGLLRPLADGRRAQERTEPSHSLLPLETQWLDSEPGLRLTCLDGCLLVNYQGEQKDIILVRGESHACATSGRITVKALVAADLLVH